MDRKILVIDDESNIRLLVRRMLSSSYTVFEASDGKVGVIMARAQRPDLILMDIMMPNMDGYSACSLIKNDPELKEVPVVMMSGLGFELNKKIAKRAGANDYITKPFTSEILKGIVSQLLTLNLSD
jgi:two-component system, OmpR family, alkaline phosphatase synthesis response regulator PhoP